MPSANSCPCHCSLLTAEKSCIRERKMFPTPTAVFAKVLSEKVSIISLLLRVRVQAARTSLLVDPAPLVTFLKRQDFKMSMRRIHQQKQPEEEGRGAEKSSVDRFSRVASGDALVANHRIPAPACTVGTTRCRRLEAS